MSTSGENEQNGEAVAPLETEGQFAVCRINKKPRP
nr:MAG TPA: hypothetical protein [Caudoviricetes sp.]